MNDKVRQLCGSYTELFAKLQYKKRKNNDKYILLGLILIFIIEYITHPQAKELVNLAPFLPKLNYENENKLSNSIMNGINGYGGLTKDIKMFKKNISPLYNYITNTHENLYKSQYIDKLSKRSIKKMKEETNLFEEQNNISLLVNEIFFNHKIKTWNTQRDDKVRKTTFHSAIDRQTVGIEDWFVVGNDRALYPAHNTLSDYDRFNCRCYLTYE